MSGSKLKTPPTLLWCFVRFDYTARDWILPSICGVYQDMVRIGRQNGAGWVVLTETDYDFNYDQTYWTRFMVVDDGLWGKVWQGELADEPMDWLISAQDTTCTDPGHFGLGAANMSGQTGFHVEFDDVMVTAQYTAFEAATWAGIKATFRF